MTESILAEESRDVLNAFTASIMSSKAQAAKGLTPVAGERPLERTPAVFPWDGAREQILASVRIIRAELSFIEEGLKKVEEALEFEQPPLVDPATALQKQVEAEADARHAAMEGSRPGPTPPLKPDFLDHWEAQQIAAQTSAFGWTCPKHDKKKIIDKVSKKGRNFRACGLCDEFEY